MMPKNCHPKPSATCRRERNVRSQWDAGLGSKVEVGAEPRLGLDTIAAASAAFRSR